MSQIDTTIALYHFFTFLIIFSVFLIATPKLINTYFYKDKISKYVKEREILVSENQKEFGKDNLISLFLTQKK